MMERREIALRAIQLLGLKTNREFSSASSEAFFHCPFHEDKSPSLSMSIDKGIYKCFSCGSGGSVEKLYREITGESLYKTLGIRIDDFDLYAFNNNTSVTDNFENSLDNINIVFKPENFEGLKYNPKVLGYLRKRGISLQMANSMGMRYTKKAFINNSLFEQRLLIPIYENKKLVSIEGRDITNKHVSDKTYPKCKYPKNSSVNTLYDIDNLDKEKPVYVVEGVLDVAVMRKYPALKNSSALFGANITKRQVYLIKQFKEFVFIPDNDQAGDKSIEYLKSLNLNNIKILRVPKEVNGIFIKDPTDYEMKTRSNLGELLSKKWLSYARPL